MMTIHVASMPDVFAEDKDLSPEIQLDSLINTATKDMEAERWDDALQNFEKAMNLGINLPGEIHFYYGKALLKTGNYEFSLSSLTNYLSLVGRERKHYEDTITLIVEAKNKQEEEKRQRTESKPQLTTAVPRKYS
jgi:predicted Zn-dependent protease